MTLVLGDESCWLSRLPLVPREPDANAVIYRKGWYWGQWGWEGSPSVSPVPVSAPPVPPLAVPGLVPVPASLAVCCQLGWGEGVSRDGCRDGSKDGVRMDTGMDAGMVVKLGIRLAQGWAQGLAQG